MNSIDLIKKSFVEATNAYAVARGIAKPFDDPQHCPSTQIPESPALPADAYSKIHTAALTAYQQNAGEHANAWKLLEEIGRKAALVDEFAKTINDIKSNDHVSDWESLFACAANDFFLKYEALPK